MGDNSDREYLIEYREIVNKNHFSLDLKLRFFIGFFNGCNRTCVFRNSSERKFRVVFTRGIYMC